MRELFIKRKQIVPGVRSMINKRRVSAIRICTLNFEL